MIYCIYRDNLHQKIIFFIEQIFKDGKLSHFIDGRGSSGNWLSYVNCARHAREQNVVVVQKDNVVFYDAARDIAVGTELLVWYDEAYIQFMGIPVTLPATIDNQEGESEEPSKLVQKMIIINELQPSYSAGTEGAQGNS